MEDAVCQNTRNATTTLQHATDMYGTDAGTSSTPGMGGGGVWFYSTGQMWVPPALLGALVLQYRTDAVRPALLWEGGGEGCLVLQYRTDAVRPALLWEGW